MRCEAVRDHLSDHLDGALPPGLQEDVARHLAACAGCREEAEGLRDVVALLRGGAPVAVPTDLMARISSALDRDDAARPVSMGCGEAEDCFTGLVEGTLDAAEARGARAHLAACEPCRLHLEQLLALVELLRSVPRPTPPAALASQVRAALHRAARPAEAARIVAVAPGAPAPAFRPVPAVARPGASWRRRWSHVASGFGGAAVACAAFLAWTWLPGVGVPHIEAAAVAVRQDVAVNIAFDLDKRVEGVVFQVDLPDGLQFIDERSQPLLAQSVSWRGSLEKGRTVVPIVVRGVRPGRYAIEAYVRKGPLKRRTTVVLPVEG